MKNEQMSKQEAPLFVAPKKEPHLLDFFTLLAKYRGLVVGITGGMAVAFVAFTFLMKHEYSAMATLLPPEKQAMSGLMSFLTGSGALDLMKGAENPATDMFKNILDSRGLSEIIAKDARVRKYFSSWDTSDKAIKFMVSKVMTSEPLRNGLMTVTVDLPTHWMPSKEQQDSAKVMSAYLANLYVTELDKYNREKLMTTAKTTRIFVEGEYRSRMRQLDSMYALLQDFQQKNKTISLTDQLQAAVTSAAMLAGEVQQLEIQLGVEQKELNANSIRIRMLQDRLSEAKHALSKYDAGGIGEYVLALKDVPALARQLAHYTREVKLLETICAFLRQQVEQERIAEQRDLPSLQILDVAEAPEKRSSPKRGQMLILGMIIGFVASSVTVMILRFKSQVRTNPEEHIRFLNFTRALRRGKNAKLIDVNAIETAQTSSLEHLQTNKHTERKNAEA